MIHSLEDMRKDMTCHVCYRTMRSVVFKKLPNGSRKKYCRYCDPVERYKHEQRKYTLSIVLSWVINIPTSCEVCGSTKNLHNHHQDYDFPLHLIRLCASCHSQFHNGKKEKAEIIRKTIKQIYASLYESDIDVFLQPMAI